MFVVLRCIFSQLTQVFLDRIHINFLSPLFQINYGRPRGFFHWKGGIQSTSVYVKYGFAQHITWPKRRVYYFWYSDNILWSGIQYLIFNLNIVPSVIPFNPKDITQNWLSKTSSSLVPFDPVTSSYMATFYYPRFRINNRHVFGYLFGSQMSTVTE